MVALRATRCGGPAARRSVDRSAWSCIGAGVVSALVALQQARAGLFEVEAVQLGSGIDLRDVLTGEQLHVREVSGTAQLKKWDAMFAWVMTVDDHLELTGATLLIPRPHLEAVREAVERELKQATKRDVVGSVGWVAVVALRRALEPAQRPQIQTTDGEQLVICKAHYEVHDGDRVRAILRQLPELETEDSDSFTWLNRSETRAVVLGAIRLDDRSLVLETMSHERNLRGRRMLEEHLGSLVFHRADTAEDIEAALRKPERSERRPDKLPNDAEREVLGQYLRDYYRRWLDEPVPALGNKSPRKAARSKRGRVQVAALLKDIENGTIAQPGGDTVDFTALRRELGLTADERPDRATYDANVAPDAADWRSTDEVERALAVEGYHRGLTKHPKTPNLKLHAVMHIVVENQLAAGNPVEVSTTLQRLVTAGLSRHEAIHAIASVVAEALFKVAKEDVDLDHRRVARELQRLDASSWRFNG